MIKVTVYRHWKRPREIYAEKEGLAFHKKGDPVIITGKYAGKYVVQSVDERLGASHPKPLDPGKAPPVKGEKIKHNPDRRQHYVKEVLLAPEGQGLDVNKYYRRSEPITVEGVK